MRKTSLLLLLLLSACLPTRHGAHYRPEVDGQPVKRHGAACGGGLGPGEVLEMRGPSGARLYATVAPAKGRMDGQLGIFAPGGVRVAVASDSFPLARVELTGASSPLPAARLGRVRFDEWDRMLPWGNGGTERRWQPPAAFTGSFEGRALGTTAWVDFDAGYAEPRPQRVIVQVPALTVGDQRWAPGAVTFEYRSSAWGIAPFNC